MLFSVVIPVFNSADYIADTLKSIDIASSSDDYEVIIVDDCSDDIDDLKDILTLFNNTLLIEKSEKSNAAESRNIGFLAARAPCVFFLDSDDHFTKNYVDNRIEYHNKSQYGLIFGNFIVKSVERERYSNLPTYHEQNMRDYLLVEQADFRSSVISIDKRYYNNTLFDENSQKHQDWIFAFKCWDNNENIGFDKNYGVIINVGRETRMSASLNVNASDYLYKNYIHNIEHINLFSKKNWRSVVCHNNKQACDFFISIYTPLTIKDKIKIQGLKLMTNTRVLPLTSRYANALRVAKIKYFKNI